MSWRHPDFEISATGWPALLIAVAATIYALEGILRTLVWITSKF